MSIKVMAKVWEGYPGGGSELLALLALADWSDDVGRCWPSIASVARKIRLSEKQTRRQIHSIIESGYLKVINNEKGGATSRRYKIQLDRLTPPTSGSPPADVLIPSHGGESTPPALGSRTVIDTSETTSDVAQARPVSSKKLKGEENTLEKFLSTCKETGVLPIPATDPIHDYAEKVGINNEMLAAVWNEFKAAYLPTTKQQNDWRAHFRNAVRRNWYKLWYLKDGESAQWTTAGEQARREAA